MELSQVNRYLAEMISAVDVRYDPYGDEHGLVGRFVPDLTLHADGGVLGVRDLFAAGRPVLLDLGGDPAVRETAAGWADRLDTVSARPAEGPTGPLLVRPDGYVAWAGAGRLEDALERWLGRPALVR